MIKATSSGISSKKVFVLQTSIYLYSIVSNTVGSSKQDNINKSSFIKYTQSARRAPAERSQSARRAPAERPQSARRAPAERPQKMPKCPIF
jgi:hypothetical protein